VADFANATVKDEKRTSFLYWASHCLSGHVVFFQIVSLPLFLFFLATDYAEHTVSVGRTISLVFLVSAAGIFVAVLGWFTVTKPLIDRQSGNK